MKSIPLFEYDCSQEAVINPDHEHFDIHLPPVCVYAFAGDTVDEFALRHNAVIVEHFLSITKKYPIYLLNYKGKEICLCQAPCGAAPATQIMDWLISYGVKHIISTGSCGVLKDIPENAFLIPYKALRDEGTSYHYLPAERYVTLNDNAVGVLEGYFTANSIPYERCITWTTDGFFRETKQKVLSRREEGCACVEMECSALASCAQFRGVSFAQFLFTADSLHAIDNYDERGWGMDSLMPALELAMDIASTVEE